LTLSLDFGHLLSFGMIWMTMEPIDQECDANYQEAGTEGAKADV
jgi:hypothetical protein